MTDDYLEQLRRTRVGEPPRLDGQVHLADYDAGWPAAFAREAARIRAALGESALLVEHVGSTSVPGLAAKPRIDICLAVASSADEPAYVPALTAAGYALVIREPEWHQHRVFKGPDVDVNLHVYTVGCSEIERNVLFRDHLRRDAGDRELYLRIKRELAARRWQFVQQYADAKSEVVEDILARAGAPPARPDEDERPARLPEAG